MRFCALACDISARCFERDKDVDILFASAPFGGVTEGGGTPIGHYLSDRSWSSKWAIDAKYR